MVKNAYTFEKRKKELAKKKKKEEKLERKINKSKSSDTDDASGDGQSALTGDAAQAGEGSEP